MKQSVYIPGRPVPNARGRHDRKTGRVYTPKRTRDYRASVKGFAAHARMQRIDGKVGISIELHMHRTGGHQGDVDNYAKGIMDALNGIAYEDDRYVDDLRVRRVWVPKSQEQGAYVDVWSLDGAGTGV